MREGGFRRERLGRAAPAADPAQDPPAPKGEQAERGGGHLPPPRRLRIFRQGERKIDRLDFEFYEHQQLQKVLSSGGS